MIKKIQTVGSIKRNIKSLANIPEEEHQKESTKFKHKSEIIKKKGKRISWSPDLKQGTNPNNSKKMSLGNNHAQVLNNQQEEMD